MARQSICSVDGCSKSSKRRGWCDKHYRRWLKYGDPVKTKSTPKGDALKFYQEVALAYEGDDCLIWPYGRDDKGYARFEIGSRKTLTSRLICEDVNGAPPTPGHHAAHSCGNGHLGCVNKTHLRWATVSENHADKIIHGTHNRGERNTMADLSESDVIDIYALKGLETGRAIAKRYGISPSTVSAIHCGIRWGWLTKKG